MKKMMIIAIIIVVVIAVAWFAISMIGKSKKLDAYMETLQIDEVDLSGVADGVYSAEIDAGLIQVSVEVTVKEHELVSINLLKHKSGQGKAANAITERMIQEQKIMVDAISGATLSSRVIQKAVETALAAGR